MLIVEIHNDGTGDATVGHYNVAVLVTTSSRELRAIARARIEGHRRAEGWRPLLRRVIEEAEDV